MRILMLTVFSERDRLFTSICNGAHGYLLKSTPPARLLDAVRAARDGGSPFSPEIARHIVSLFQKTGPVSAAVLTAQEQRLLSLLAEGYSYQSAGDRMNVSVNTVRNYIRSVYEKLHVHSKSEAVSKALRHGLIG
jgi:DNA-binding NarL/FixJ family response regulator